MTKNVKDIIIATLFTIFASVVSAVALHVFVYPAKFVPLGLEAIVTLLYAIFPKINSGIFNLLLNAPLVILAWFKLDKKYVVYTMLFTLLSSLMLLLLGGVNFPQYQAPDGRIISAIFAGVMLGVRTGVMLKISASTGGVDIIACIVQKKMPYVNVERIISFLCIAIIGISYFVYKDFNCILLGLVQLFISEKTTSFIMRDSREALEVKIVTNNPDELYGFLVDKLGHSATIVNSYGLYLHQANYVVFSIINRRQLSEIVNISRQYPNTFIYYNEVCGVYGKFRKRREDPL